jgi:hypothetical protein
MNPVPNQTIFSININTTESVNDILVHISTIHNINTNTTESDPFIGFWSSGAHGNRIFQYVYSNGNITIYSGTHAIITFKGEWKKTGENTYFVRILESDEPHVSMFNETISYNPKTDTLFGSFSSYYFNQSYGRIERPSP